MTHIDKGRSSAAFALSRKLQKLLRKIPERTPGQDSQSYAMQRDSALANIKASLEKTEPACRIRTRFDGTAIHAHGISASCERGLLRACENYIAQVAVLCAQDPEDARA